MFSSLLSLTEVSGCRFLDLYAGSGGLGLEALSRGAATVTLVESDPQALVVLRRNAEALGLFADIVASDVPRFLTGAARPYDVIVLDPPYGTDVDPVLEQLLDWLTPDGIVVVERSTRGPALRWPTGLVGLRSRRYGHATLWYGSRS